MNKSIIGAVTAAVVVIAGAPALSGWLVERGASERVEAIASQVPFLSVSSHSYRRGWLSSEETTTFEFLKGVKLPATAGPAPAEGARPAARPAPLLVTVHSTIQHGPLPGFSSIGLARVESTIRVAAASAAPAAQPSGFTNPTIETVLGFLGGGRTTVTSRAYAEVPFREHGHLSADPVELVVEFTRHLDRFDVDWKAPHVLLREDDGARFELSGFHMTAHNHRVLRSLYAGESELTIGAVQSSGIPAKDGPLSVELKVLHAQSRAEAVGDFLNTSVQFTLSAATAAGKSLQGIKFDFSADHFQTDALERLAAGSRAATADADADAATRSAALLKVWQSAGVPLATHDPAVTIRAFEFVTTDGFARLSGSVGMKGATESDFAPPMDMRRLIPKIALDLDILVDEELAAAWQAARQPPADAPLPPRARRTGAQPAPARPDPLQSLIAQGFVTREGTRLRTKIAFAKGVLSVNGKPFPGAPPAAAR